MTSERESLLPARLDRIEKAVSTLAWWLVEAQTGFADRDAKGIDSILGGEMVVADLSADAEERETLDDAIKKHEPLTLYESGLVEGLRMYSWMKDGVTYVGTTGTTLGVAVDRAIEEARQLWPTKG